MEKPSKSNSESPAAESKEIARSKAVEKPTQKSSEKPTEQSSQKPSDKPSQRTEEASKTAGKKRDLLGTRSISLPPKMSNKPVEKAELGKHHVGKLQEMQVLQERHIRLRILEAQIEALKEGELFVEDFLDFLESLFEAVELEREELRGTYTSCEQFQEMFELQIEKAEAGYAYLLEALERIAMFCEDEDEAHLEEGLVTYTKGGFLLFEIMDEMAEIEGEDENRLKM